MGAVRAGKLLFLGQVGASPGRAGRARRARALPWPAGFGAGGCSGPPDRRGAKWRQGARYGPVGRPEPSAGLVPR